MRGRGGAVLHEQWRSGASAFHGLAAPGFPNAYLLAGPNTFNPAGSNPAMKQRQIDYIMKCLRWRNEIGTAAIEVDNEAMQAQQRWMQQAIAETVWPDAGPSWYKHPSGAVTNPWPASARRFDQMLRQSPAMSFHAVPAAPITSQVDIG